MAGDFTPGGRGIDVQVGRVVSSAGTITVSSANVRSARLKPAGIRTVVHEAYHAHLYRTGQDPKDGDKPDSKTGPAEKEGIRVEQEKPDMSRKEATALVDRLIPLRDVP